MDLRVLGLLLCIFSSVILPTAGLEPVTMTLVVAGGFGAALGGLWKAYRYGKDNVEMCNSDWVVYNATGLKNDLENKLFGQHIASKLLFQAVDEFMRDGSSRKPLVLSLHGLTGTGKNYASKIIAGNLYRRGMDSEYVNLLSTTKHFPQPARLENYKGWLKAWLRYRAVACQRSVFILDEVDKMDPALMDVVKGVLDNWSQEGAELHRKSVFIFLSNTGGESIADKALDFWRGGRDRKEMELEDLRSLLSLPVFTNSQGDFSRVSLIEGYLIDVFVPFLPLEYDHVMQCVLAAMLHLNVQPKADVADMLTRDLGFFPKSDPIFSSVGCKTVEKRLSFYL